MSGVGVEVRIVTVQNRDDALGAENPATENAGAVELWRGGERVAELVWWEQDILDVGTLTPKTELYSSITVAGDVHHRTHQLRREP